ncbi:MAG: hypothetical protein U0800_11515 [Isosphaeraceae bacterium]
MRPGFVAIGLLWMSAGITGESAAQQPQPQSPSLTANGIGPYFQPPGAYGTSYGTPSFGVPRLYTAFSSPYGGGYGYGYGPYVTSLNWYQLNGGLQSNRPGYTVPGYYYAGSEYNTFPVPYTVRGAESPPIGVYAPTIGPAWFVNR